MMLTALKVLAVAIALYCWLHIMFADWKWRRLPRPRTTRDYVRQMRRQRRAVRHVSRAIKAHR